jgi:AAA domain-containing protein
MSTANPKPDNPQINTSANVVALNGVGWDRGRYIERLKKTIADAKEALAALPPNARAARAKQQEEIDRWERTLKHQTRPLPPWRPIVTFEQEEREREQRQTKALADTIVQALSARRSTVEPKPTLALAQIQLTFFADLSDSPTSRPWLIKNVIARNETSSWIAPPGKGKSALLTDIAVHLAAEKDWRGHRTKEHFGVVYFALERADLVRRRLTAYKLRDGFGDLPIAVTGQMIDLLDRRCVDQILAAIRDAEQRFDCGVGLVIFDTYAKGIAAGGGDEDKAKDQNIVQANLRRLFERGCHVHVAGVGHTGKDESRGERGSNARLADVDMLVQITGDIVKVATITKANDQPEGVLTAFKLEPFEFGLDEDGDPFRTFIVGPEMYQAESASRQRPSDKQMLALRALADVVLAQGREPPPNYLLPPDIKVVDADAWREELYRRNVLDRDAGNPRARFKELRNGLAVRSLIGDRDDVIWLVRSI